MNRLLDRYPLTTAFLAAVTWISGVVWITEVFR